MRKSIKSVYIHIPFCSSICSYCDFSKMLYEKRIVNKYLKSLELEIKQKYGNEIIETIYIGGGTPSALDCEDLEKLFGIIKIFKLSKNVEFTFECNINDINEEKIKIFKNNGVNRVSLGVQTLKKETLEKMKREHKYENVKEKILLLKKNDIKNINVDLIYAFPNTSLNDLKEDLDKIFSLNITHISTYSLIIEPHTLLYIKNIKNIDQDLDYEMYRFICEEMKKHGFVHYEISNFCKTNYESKHNLTYWNNEQYYGFGLSASGYIDSVRYTNTRNMNDYCNRKYIAECENLSIKDKIVYELILGLRKIKGIEINKINQKYGIDLLNNKIIAELLKKGSLEQNGLYLNIPYEKIYTENEVLMELLDYE